MLDEIVQTAPRTALRPSETLLISAAPRQGT
jgi:hypothetical protein